MRGSNQTIDIQGINSMADCDFTRECTRCGVALPATKAFFHAAPLGKYGLKSVCKQCCAQRHLEKREETLRKNKERYEANKETILAKQHEYYAKNRDAINERAAERRARDAEKRREQRKRYYQENKEAISAARKEQRRLGLVPKRPSRKEYYAKNREQIVEYMRAWRERNAEQVQEYMRNWRKENWPELLKRKQAYERSNKWAMLRRRVGTLVRKSLKEGKRGRSLESVLGYTCQELASHIEKQFTKGMTWERFANGEIHIDHIVPVSHLRPECVEDDSFKACWALANLRPVWAKDNLAKAARLEFLL